jgi:hypothetical protein
MDIMRELKEATGVDASKIAEAATTVCEEIGVDSSGTVKEKVHRAAAALDIPINYESMGEGSDVDGPLLPEAVVVATAVNNDGNGGASGAAAEQEVTLASPSAKAAGSNPVAQIELKNLEERCVKSSRLQQASRTLYFSFVSFVSFVSFLSPLSSPPPLLLLFFNCRSRSIANKRDNVLLTNFHITNIDDAFAFNLEQASRGDGRSAKGLRSPSDS